MPGCEIWWDGREEIHLINSLPWEGSSQEANPASIVRLVNRLHSLGKERADELLREYLKVASPMYDNDGYNQQKLCILVPLIFQKQSQQLVPPPPLYADAGKAETWPGFDVLIEGQIPFHTFVNLPHTKGVCPPRDYLIDWAAAKCRFRDHRLQPVDNPFDAARAVAERTRSSYSFGYHFLLKRYLYRQAEAMVAHLDLENPEEAQLRWDDESQEYVLAE